MHISFSFNNGSTKLIPAGVTFTRFDGDFPQVVPSPAVTTTTASGSGIYGEYSFDPAFPIVASTRESFITEGNRWNASFKTAIDTFSSNDTGTFIATTSTTGYVMALTDGTQTFPTYSGDSYQVFPGGLLGSDGPLYSVSTWINPNIYPQSIYGDFYVVPPGYCGMVSDLKRFYSTTRYPYFSAINTYETMVPGSISRTSSSKGLDDNGDPSTITNTYTYEGPVPTVSSDVSSGNQSTYLVVTNVETSEFTVIEDRVVGALVNNFTGGLYSSYLMQYYPHRKHGGENDPYFLWGAGNTSIYPQITTQAVTKTMSIEFDTSTVSGETYYGTTNIPLNSPRVGSFTAITEIIDPEIDIRNSLILPVLGDGGLDYGDRLILPGGAITYTTTYDPPGMAFVSPNGSTKVLSAEFGVDEDGFFGSSAVPHMFEMGLLDENIAFVPRNPAGGSFYAIVENSSSWTKANVDYGTYSQDGNNFTISTTAITNGIIASSTAHHSFKTVSAQPSTTVFSEHTAGELALHPGYSPFQTITFSGLIGFSYLYELPDGRAITTLLTFYCDNPNTLGITGDVTLIADGLICNSGYGPGIYAPQSVPNMI